MDGGLLLYLVEKDDHEHYTLDPGCIKLLLKSKYI